MKKGGGVSCRIDVCRIILNDADALQGASTPDTWSSYLSSNCGESSISSSNVKTLSLPREERERVRLFVMGAKSTDIGKNHHEDMIQY